MPQRLRLPDRDLTVGYDALQPYLMNDDLWSPSDDLARLFENQTVRMRVGEIIAHGAETAPKRRS